jgi:hypothetical protein
MQQIQRGGHWLWRVVQPPDGSGARKVLAGVMLIMALGRLGLYRSALLATALSAEQYGWLLLLLGLALAATLRRRLHLGGRLVAALSALLLAGMAWDVGAWGVTALLEAWLAYGLLGETFTRHD